MIVLVRPKLPYLVGSSLLQTTMLAWSFRGTVGNGLVFICFIIFSLILLSHFQDAIHVRDVFTNRPFTTELWVLVQEDSPAMTAILGNDHYTQTTGGLILSMDENGIISFGFFDKVVSSSHPMKRGVWFFVSCSLSASHELALYINGELVGYSRNAGTYEINVKNDMMNNDELTLGRARSILHLVGMICGFRFWQCCRSSQEIGDAWNRKLGRSEWRNLTRLWEGQTCGALPLDQCSNSGFWVRASRIRYRHQGPELKYQCPSLITLCKLKLSAF